MSKELEALLKLHMMALSDVQNERQETLCNSHFETLKQAIKRNEPTKVAYDKNGVSFCPNCHQSYLRNAMGNENHYCGNCGQKLDWSDYQEYEEDNEN